MIEITMAFPIASITILTIRTVVDPSRAGWVEIEPPHTEAVFLSRGLLKEYGILLFINM